MIVNAAHPRYSVPMELLCLLPVEPTRAPVAEVRCDLQLDGWGLRRAINALREGGIRVVSAGGALAIAKDCVPDARAAGEEYWHSVYDDLH